MALVIAGRVVTLDGHSDPDRAGRAKVLIDDNGLIEAIIGERDPAPASYKAVTPIDVGNAWVMPGLIDLHTHVAYNTLPLWLKAGQATPFAYHESWNKGDDYHQKVMWPYSLLAQAAPEALLAWVQTRALVGGTTSMQGWPTANRSYFRSVREIDTEQAGQPQKVMEQSIATLQEGDLIERAKDERGRAGKLPRGFIYHCAEGQPAPGSAAANEFRTANRAGCLTAGIFIAIHCTALEPTDWTAWRNTSGAVVWSPFSNLWLYGTTMDIGSAKAEGVPMCLGSDWGPSGTKNVLGELKVAKLVVQQRKKDLKLPREEFTDEELVRMVTTNPGDVLQRCWKQPVGRLTAGGFGDITVLGSHSGGKDSFWTDVVNATEVDVELVVVDGVPRYGKKEFMKQAPLAVDIDVAPRIERTVALADPSDKTNKTAWSWRQVSDRIDAVRRHPAEELAKTRRNHHAYGGPIDDIEAPLQLEIDIPDDVLFAFPDLPDDPDEVKIPELPSLIHDDDEFFKAIGNNPIHKGVLDGLAGFYRGKK
jgi:cytosine/adenosine deaminase-related metal-dependent hydrolase